METWLLSCSDGLTFMKIEVETLQSECVLSLMSEPVYSVMLFFETQSGLHKLNKEHANSTEWNANAGEGLDLRTEE